MFVINKSCLTVSSMDLSAGDSYRQSVGSSRGLNTFVLKARHCHCIGLWMGCKVLSLAVVFVSFIKVS